MAKDKVLTDEPGTAKVEFPDIDEQGFQKVMSAEGEVVYAKEVPCGCEKRIIVVKKDGTVVTDTTEFKQGAYIRAWTCNGAPFRHELMGGN